MPIDPPNPTLTADPRLVAVPATAATPDTTTVTMGLTARDGDVVVDIVYSLADDHTIYFKRGKGRAKQIEQKGRKVLTDATTVTKTLGFVGGPGARQVRVFTVTAVITPRDGSAAMRTSETLTIDGPIP